MLISGSCETGNEKKEKTKHMKDMLVAAETCKIPMAKKQEMVLTKRRYCLTSCEFFMCRSLCLNLSRMDNAKNTTMLGDPPMTMSRILQNDMTP